MFTQVRLFAIMSFLLALCVFAVAVVGSNGGVEAAAELKQSNSAIRSITGTSISIIVSVYSGVYAYSVQENLPAGLSAFAVSAGGSYNPSSNSVSWGPFQDSNNRTLTYSVQGTDGTYVVSGFARFDNSQQSITGESTITIEQQQPCYTLTVNSGTASTLQNCAGGYSQGTVVGISANTPPAGQVFDRWTGSISTVADVNSPTTTIRMDSNKAVTATYRPIPQCFGLAINSGSATTPMNCQGGYTVGTLVTIIADAPPPGQVFAMWTGDIGTVTDVNSQTTTIVMDSAKTITATYRAASECFLLTVTGGSAATTENCQGGYDAGSVVTIIADPPPTGQVFAQWTGDIDTVTNVNSATTTLTMNGNKIVNATYRDADEECFTLSVNAGAATTTQNCAGGYTEGTMVTITANEPPVGQQFNRWTGDIATIGDVRSATTTITMDRNLVVTATYADAVDCYTLVVINGSALSPANCDRGYIPGSRVSIAADDPPAARVFDVWTGDVDTVEDVNDANTVIVMDSTKQITATYRLDPTVETPTVDEFRAWLETNFEAADTNDDGMLTYEEVIAVFPEVPQDIFDIVDLDGDGMISMEEAEPPQQTFICCALFGFKDAGSMLGDLLLLTAALGAALCMRSAVAQRN